MSAPSTPERALALADEEPPFAAGLGVEIVGLSEGLVVAELTVAEAHRNRNGVMHGGAIMAFADCLGGTAASFHIREGAKTSTIESKTNFLAPIRIGERIRGECRVLHAGRTTMVLQTDILRPDGRKAAVVLQTQILLDR